MHPLECAHPLPFELKRRIFVAHHSNLPGAAFRDAHDFQVEFLVVGAEGTICFPFGTVFGQETVRLHKLFGALGTFHGQDDPFFGCDILA